MRVKIQGDIFFVWDYVYKNDGSVDVLVNAPNFPKRWMNVSRDQLIETDKLPDNKDNHYE